MPLIPDRKKLKKTSHIKAKTQEKRKLSELVSDSDEEDEEVDTRGEDLVAKGGRTWVRITELPNIRSNSSLPF